ncbi:MAG: peptidoglycan-binding protein [Oscillospiraceae bacterium]|jgi:hypothetical protein|nr:peptidoglycan-binding protein [Oscillospiraceae bacterium]
MAIGKLRIRVFENTMGKPVTQARFRISTTSNNQTLFESSTNDNGLSEIIELEAPSLDYSQEPTEKKPYNECDIWVEKPGFERIVIKGTQIFPDVIADQDVFVNSLQENSNNAEIDYIISDHVLYGNYPQKINEEEVKPLSNPSGFVVLAAPVVPEYIVVHDGIPEDSSAKNYWIHFKDYIKNVCSSEIYPTWPTETIRANALAIISFTLNRVFTEWYKNKGYNFTITSVTRYDQKFIYQRNIFNEVSVIIDELFSSYITKPNIDQPLFAQYCDGQRLDCPKWLSQWGSKRLGDNGADYMSILRNYYGSDIYLEIANQIAGIPSSYPGNILQTGSSGASVRTIQSQLNSISNNFPAISKIAVDGVFGSATTQATKIFQSVFNLPQTGIIDYATWYEISKIYVAVNKLS